MLPARQRFDADDAIGRERDDRLVDEAKLAAIERDVEFLFQLRFSQRRADAGDVKQLDARTGLRARRQSAVAALSSTSSARR